MIRKIGQAFVLDTAHTTYAFSILPGGHPEHLYYGRTIHIEHPDDLEILVGTFLQMKIIMLPG